MTTPNLNEWMKWKKIHSVLEEKRKHIGWKRANMQKHISEIQLGRWHRLQTGNCRYYAENISLKKNHFTDILFPPSLPDVHPTVMDLVDGLFFTSNSLIMWSSGLYSEVRFSSAPISRDNGSFSSYNCRGLVNNSPSSASSFDTTYFFHTLKIDWLRLLLLLTWLVLGALQLIAYALEYGSIYSLSYNLCESSAYVLSNPFCI